MKHLLFATALSALAMCACLPSAGAPMVERGGAFRYHAWLQSCLSALRRDLPAIGVSADAAAHKFVLEGYSIGAWGDGAFVSEFTARAGGLMPVVSVKPTETRNTIVLAALRDEGLADDLVELARLSGRGNFVIAFARHSVLMRAQHAGAKLGGEVVNHAATNGGMLEIKSKWVVPTDPTANIAALWTWTAEFVSGCSRLGKLPAVWQSIMVPGSSDRNARFREMKFIPEDAAAVPPERLGRKYLRGVSILLDQIYRADNKTLLKIAGLAGSARKANRSLYAVFFGHALGQQLGCEHDPGMFKPISGAKIEKGDLVFGVGYDKLMGEPSFKNAAESARAAGASCAWSFSSYNADEVNGVASGEPYIDQRWALGDAIVLVPGYDVKVLPPSGVIGEFIFWAVNAEVLRPGGAK